MKNLADFSRISKISAGYTWISDTGELWSNSNKLEKSMKTAMVLSNLTTGYQGYQPDTNAFPVIMSCHSLTSPLPRNRVQSCL